MTLDKNTRDVLADAFQQLKLTVHNRLFETPDALRSDSNLGSKCGLDQVTQPVTKILIEEGRLLTDADCARLVQEIKNELAGVGSYEPRENDRSTSSRQS
jgi:hypothetical protein